MPSGKPSNLPPLLPKPAVSTSTTLRRISCNALELVNARDFEQSSPAGRELLSHLHPDFQARLDNYDIALTFSQANQICAQWGKESPTVHFSTEKVDVIVDEEAGEGTVFIDIDCTGLKEPVRIRGFLEIKWKREAGDRWMLWRCNGMRNMPHGGGGCLKKQAA